MQLTRSLLVFSAASASLLALAGCGSNTVGSGNTGTSAYTGAKVYLVSSTAPSSVLVYPSGTANTPNATSFITLPSGTVAQYMALDPAADVYVTTSTDVREYATGASGTATPTRTLLLNSTTTLNTMPTGLAADASGNIYVSEATAGAVAIFSGSATGSVAPTRFIAGANTTLVNPFQLAVDSAGNLYVMNFIAAGQVDIVEFGPTANGNVAPLRTLNVNVIGFTVNPAGSVYAATQSGVQVFAPGASGNSYAHRNDHQRGPRQRRAHRRHRGRLHRRCLRRHLRHHRQRAAPASPSIEQFASVSGKPHPHQHLHPRSLGHRQPTPRPHRRPLVRGDPVFIRG